MSISFRKINSMIDDEISYQELTNEQNKLLIDVCTQIYRIESSLEKGGNNQVISDIRGEISLMADNFREIK